MSLHFYCPECLDDDGHCGEFDSCANTPQGRRERAAADLRITLILQRAYSRPDRLYNLRAMPADGACFFHAIAFLPNENLLSFCHEVAKFASSWYDKRWLPEKQDRADFIACWKSVRRCRSAETVVEPIIRSWRSSCGDVAPVMMGDFLDQKRGHKQLVVHSCLSVDGEMERVRFP